MLQRFPSVQRWAETGDVLQNALMRLLRSLQDVEPESMRRFYGLAAEQMRRELLDLARHYQSGRGCPLPRPRLPEDSGSGSAVLDPADDAPDPHDLERWCSFHEEVENRLPRNARWSA